MSLAPRAALLAYGLAFGVVALGWGLPAFDDHPGQLARIWHVVRHGPAPWAWSPDWWAGYPELQFYPPAFPWIGAGLHAATGGTLPVETAYLVLVWLAYLAPGLAVHLLLTRRLGDGWLALPGGFVALTLSAWPGLASGVEGGIHVGMVPARLGWALLPLLALALERWAAAAGRFPVGTAIPLVALIVLTHPAHAPAAVALLGTAALLRPPRGRRLLAAAAALTLAAGLTAVWTVPLLARLEHTRALAWGRLDLAGMLGAHPLLVVLLVLAVLAPVVARSSGDRLLALWPPSAGALVALDALVLEPAGRRWLPADRVLDGAWLAVVLAAGLTAGRLGAGRALPRPLLALVAVAGVIALSLAGDRTLTLWPTPRLWPTYAATERGLRLPALWAALREAPEGRALFVRSSVPLAFGTEWWRPHTHVPALAPLHAGRPIVNGTFTHASPVAALVYRGEAGPGPIRRLVEELDGHSLLGQPLEALDGAALDRLARTLGVSVIVALDEDVPRLSAALEGSRFAARRTEPPFVLYTGPPVSLPSPGPGGSWEITLAGTTGAWTSARMACYPLWHASAGDTRLETRCGPHADLQVRLPGPSAEVTLRYRPGAPELSGLALTVLAAAAWPATAAIRRRRGATAAPPA